MNKVLLLCGLLLMGTTSFASSLICQEVGKNSLNRKVILHQVEGGELTPYSTKRFDMILADNSSKNDVLRILLKTSGILEVGDVDFTFVSDDQSVEFTTYVDDENSGRLSIAGGVGGQFNCQYR